MDYQKDFGIDDNRTPLQCRNGPLQQRRCTDILCCLIYILLLGLVITFAVLSINAMSISRAEIEAQVAKSEFGAPFISLSQNFFPILLAVGCVILICLILVLTTFIIPSIVAYIYIPVALLLMLLLGAVFLFIFFGNTLPFVDSSYQDRYIEKNSVLSLGIGIGFLVAFVLAAIVICSKKEKFKNIVPVLQIAKVCFWQNCFSMLAVSLILSILSICALYLNIYFLFISQDKKDSQHYIPTWIMTLIILVQVWWTHGVLQALSDFLFEAIAINWYFNGRKYGQDYSRCGKNGLASIGLLCKHIGTVIFGHILAYMPEEINTILRRFEQKCTGCYSVCCFCHKFMLRSLTKYCYTQTILQSHGFVQANRDMFELKRRTKATLPELYMMGNFYMTLSKILILMFSLTIVYFLLVQQDENYYFENIVNLIVPLLVIFSLFFRQP